METDPAAIRAAVAAGEVKRVLVLRAARVGDTLHVRPALELLRAALPEAFLVFLCSDYAHAAARGVPVDRLVPYRHKGRSPGAMLARWRVRLELSRLGPFDLCLALEDKPWGRRLAQRLGCHFWHATSASGTHVVERKAGVLAELGLWNPSSGPPPPVRWTAQGRAGLPELPRPQVGWQVGSHALRFLRPPRRRRDPAPSWLVEAASAVHAAHGGAAVLNAGDGGAESRVARQVARELEARGIPHHVLAGRDLDGLGAALSTLDAFVSANTGPVHMAAALGVPVVLLEGPTPAAVAPPWRADPMRRLRLGLECSPCSGTEHGRRCAEPRCLDGIEAQSVVRAVGELLALPGRS